jgi:hypothetical protein
MSICYHCDSPVLPYIYKCDVNDYRVSDLNDNLVKIITLHEIPSDDTEISDYTNIEYCVSCEKFIDAPYNYDNTTNNFKSGNNNLNIYMNFLKNNIIHTFENINCQYCSKIMKKGQFTINVDSDDGSNLLNPIKIYDTDNNQVKSFNIIDNKVYMKMNTYTSDNSKKLVYCEDCDHVYLNNLKQIYQQ